MKKHSHHDMRHASALLVVLLVLAVASIVAAAMLSTVTFEMKMARRYDALSELRRASDSLLNYAASQAQGNPLLIPSGIKASPEDLFKGGSNDYTLVLPAEQEIYVSPVSRMTDEKGLAKRFYINPNAPINRNDDLRDKNVYRDIFMIAAKAAVTNPSNPAEALYEHSCMVVERRQFSVFNYLAFFDVASFRVTNPGSNIILDGPVHSNLGIYFESSNHPSTVYIDSTVHTPGKLDFSGSTYAGRFMVTNGTLLPNGTPTRVDLLKPGSSVLRESSDGKPFELFMLNDTKGYLKTGAVGGPSIELDGLNYVDDSANSSTPDKFKICNNRRIDPPNPELRNTTDEAYADARIAETAKTAYQAKLYTYVETTGDMTVFTSQKNAESYKNASDKAAWKNSNGDKFVDPAVASTFVSVPYVVRYNDGATDYVSGTKNTDLARGAIYDSQQKATVGMVDVNLGNLNTSLTSGSLRLANGSDWNTKGTTGWNGVLYVDVQNPGVRPLAPVRDFKTGYYIDNVSKKPLATTTPATAIKVPLPSLNVTGTAQAWDTGKAVTDTTGLTAVRVKNAADVPSALVGDPGFTLATNTATYTVGSVNADGNLSTGTTALQDDQTGATSKTEKIPAAIFSDKNIVLSNDFSNASFDLDLYVPKPSSKPAGMTTAIYNAWPFTGPKASSTTYALDGRNTSSGADTNGHYQYQRDPGNRTGGNRVMELSCAFIVGDDDNSNKGIHTILSYLQTFNSTADTLRMRGSVIGIYKARYFKATAGSFNNYYVAPQRTFGYSSLLKAGKMPPASPTISSFRRMRQFVLTKFEYEQIKAGPNTLDGWLDVLGNK